MPKEKEDVEIQSFGGLYGGAGSENLPNDVFEWAFGMDPIRAPGTFKGLPDDELIANFVGLVEGWILTQDGDTAVCLRADGFGSTEILVIEGLPDTATIVHTAVLEDFPEFPPGHTARFGGGISDGNTVYIAMGRDFPYLWVGKINGAWFVKLAQTKPGLAIDGFGFGAHVWTPSTDGQHAEAKDIYPFISERGYSWKVSLLYDNLHESPLSDVELIAIPNGHKESITFPIVGPGALDERVTHLILYRAEGGQAERKDRVYNTMGGVPVSFEPPPGMNTGTVIIPTFEFDEDTLGEYRIVKTISADGLTFPLQVVDNGEIGQSYLNRTGLPQSIQSQNVGFDLITRYENVAFVAGVNVLDSTDDDDAAPYKLARSKPYRFASYDWSVFYRLETIPRAMIAFQGRIWVFDSGRCYVFTPDIGDPEILEGIGVEAPESVFATETGMIAAGRKQIWFNDRTGFRAIGDPILSLLTNNGVDVGYAKRLTDEPPTCLYDGNRNLFYVVYQANDGVLNQTWILLYDPAQRKWGLSGITTAFVYGGFVSNTGEPMLAVCNNALPVFPVCDTALYKLNSAESTRAFHFRTKVFKEGTKKQVFYEMFINGDPPLKVEIRENIDAWLEITQQVGPGGLHKYVVNSTPRQGVATGEVWRRVQKFQLRVYGDVDQQFDSFVLQRLVQPVV